MEERRQHPRKKVTYPIAVIDQDREHPLGYLVDISVCGFMLITPSPLEVNCVFQLSLELPKEYGGHAIPLGAESLWRENSKSHDKYWAGFRIIDISPESRQLIHRLIEEYL